MMTTMMVIHSIPWLFIYLESLLLLLFLFAIHLNAPFFVLFLLQRNFMFVINSTDTIVSRQDIALHVLFFYCVPLFVCVSMCVSELYLQKCKLVLLELCWVSP